MGVPPIFVATFYHTFQLPSVRVWISVLVDFADGLVIYMVGDAAGVCHYYWRLCCHGFRGCKPESFEDTREYKYVRCPV